MTIRRKRLAFFLSVILLASCSAEAPSKTAATPAPEYQAVTMQGDAVTLESLRGNVVLLNVWATWCAPCREEIPYLSELHASRAGEGLKVVGVSVDTAADGDKVRSLAASLPIPYEVWLDPEERVGQLFSAFNLPVSMLIDREGRVLLRHAGVVRKTTPGFEKAIEDALRDKR